MSTDFMSSLTAIIEPAVTQAGYDVVEWTYRREQTGWILRVTIDVKEGSVKFEDCEIITNLLNPLLDELEPPHPYDFEVSSPGLDRPLTRDRDWSMALGKTVRVQWIDAEGVRRDAEGKVLGFDDQAVTLAGKNKKDEPKKIDRASIAKARRVMIFSELVGE